MEEYQNQKPEGICVWKIEAMNRINAGWKPEALENLEKCYRCKGYNKNCESYSPIGKEEKIGKNRLEKILNHV